MIANQGAFFWVAAASFLALLLLGYVGVYRSLVLPLRRLTFFAHETATRLDLQNVKPPSFDSNESTSANEIHKQSHALQALYESMWTAIKHIEGTLK